MPQQNNDTQTTHSPEKHSTIAIIGGGWFGKAFAKQQVSEGNRQIILTTQTPEKLAEFEAIGVKGSLLSFPLASQPSTSKAVFEQDILIIAIPPGFKKGRTDYAENIAEIVALAEQENVKHIVLLNSTAIYNGLAGEVNEESDLVLSANKVALLAQAECELFKFSGKSSSLRLAGLIGDDRHPGRFVQNAIKQNREVPEPNAYVNLIHQKDVIGLVKALIYKGAQGIFNGVSSTHITKREYYNAAAQSLGLLAPQFKISENKTTDSKKVTDDKTRQMLQYGYQVDNLITWLTKK